MTKENKKSKSRKATQAEFNVACKHALDHITELRDRKMETLAAEYNNRLRDKPLNRKATEAWYKAETIKTQSAFAFLAAKINSNAK